MPRHGRTALWACGLVLAALAAARPAAATEEYKDRFEHSYTLTASGKFALVSVNGPVAVTAWERNEVHVVAEKKVKAANAQAGKERLAAIRIEVSEKAGEVRIDTKFPKSGSWFSWGGNDSGSVAYTVQVPKGVKVDVETVNGAVSVQGAGDLRAESTNGAIEVNGVRGTVHLATVNGHIAATDAAGAVVADTTNGHIEVELKEAAKGQAMKFSTVNGGIKVRVPATLQASIHAETTNGRVTTDLAVDTHGEKAKKHRLDGDLNGGGAKLDLATTNGSIDIQGKK